MDAEAAWTEQNARGKRSPRYEKYEVPKRLSWTADTEGRDPRRLRMRYFNPNATRQLVRYHLVPGQMDPERLLRATGDIISGRNPVMRSLDPLGFRFRKVLGQGGGGLVILVELEDQNGQMDQWVVKVPRRNGNMGREASNMRVSEKS